MPTITPVGTINLDELEMPQIAFPLDSIEQAGAIPVECERRPLICPVSRSDRFRAWLNDWTPERYTHAKPEGFVGTPRVRFRLNVNNANAVDAQIAPFGGKRFKWCIAALNSRSIRAGGWQYEYTTGTPTCWLGLSSTITGSSGTIYGRSPMSVIINRRPDAWADWIHFCRILIHEFEGHGTNEFGFNWPNGGHVRNSLALMSYQPIDHRVINPFLPSAVNGLVRWGLASDSEYPAFQRIAGPPIYKD